MQESSLIDCVRNLPKIKSLSHNYLGAIPKVLTPVKETALAPHEKIRRRKGQQYLDSRCPVGSNK